MGGITVPQMSRCLGLTPQFNCITFRQIEVQRFFEARMAPYGADSFTIFDVFTKTAVYWCNTPLFRLICQVSERTFNFFPQTRAQNVAGVFLGNRLQHQGNPHVTTVMGVRG